MQGSNRLRLPCSFVYYLAALFSRHISFRIRFRALRNGLTLSLPPNFTVLCASRLAPHVFQLRLRRFSCCVLFSALVCRCAAGSDRDVVGWFCGFAFVFSSQCRPLWLLVGLSQSPFPPAVFSRATSNAMLRSCDCVSCFAMKVPISLLLRLLGSLVPFPALRSSSSAV